VTWGDLEPATQAAAVRRDGALIDDPRLKHGMTFFYGLQHRRLSVKKADAG
jgi:hypothetical protein